MSDDARRPDGIFDAPAAGYDRLIGRYLPTLAPALADNAAVGPGMRVLDVGCGPGGLTQELVSRVGAASVAAIDPSPPFVQACRLRNPGADVREGFAESLPFDDGSFDAALSSLVVGFMTDPVAGIREMARVTKPGGLVVACVWDRQGMTALRIFGQTMVRLDPALSGDIKLTGDAEGELARVFTAAGLAHIDEGVLLANGHYADFDDWWEPFTLGIGPHGAYYQTLDDERRETLRLACREQFKTPDQPFTLEARARCARGSVGMPGNDAGRTGHGDDLLA
ncbi:MAG: methyltransferase domain-containing protein [Actinomycetota bacterium]|nr:methyltransferase domain-containing protein [Actinomycetota bacterium]